MSLRLIHPLPEGVPTDAFGWRPAIPGVRPAELHDGQDWAATPGTRVRAAHAGRVTYAGWDPTGGGWMVKISAARCTTLYLHLRDRPPVRAGDAVKAGQTIGRIGSTGNSTGPHLHFILRMPDGRAVNPIPYLEDTMTPTEMQQLADLVAARILTTPVKTQGQPEESTNLRAMIASAPRRHADIRQWVAGLRALIRSKADA